MRIIGGKDFYDNAMAHGQDRSVAFLRQRHENAPVVDPKETSLGSYEKAVVHLDKGVRWWSDSMVFGIGEHRMRISPTCVWIAGKRHGGFQACWSEKGPGYSHTEMAVRFWDYDSFVVFLARWGVSLDVRGRRHDGRRRMDDVGVAQHFSDKGSDRARDWMIENGKSIAIWHHHFSEIGWKFDTDGLKAMDFASVLDPWSAFQELSMWIGGTLPRPGPEIVELTGEKVMVAKHGFNEWSFRKQGTRS